MLWPFGTQAIEKQNINYLIIFFQMEPEMLMQSYDMDYFEENDCGTNGEWFADETVSQSYVQLILYI